MFSVRVIWLGGIFIVGILVGCFIDSSMASDHQGLYFSSSMNKSSLAIVGSGIIRDKAAPQEPENDAEPEKTLWIVASKDAVNADPTLKADFYCDGIHDELVIQQALNLTRNFNGKRIVQLTRGTFTINANIRMQDGNVLQGMGMDETMIQLKPNSAPFTHAGAIRGNGVSNFTVKDLTVHGNRMLQTNKDPKFEYGKYGFYCQVCNDVLMENVRIMSFQGYGFDPHGNAGELAYTERFVIRGCVSMDNGWDGYTIDKTKNAIIENSIARNNGNLVYEYR
jgi:hypothetical protein